MEPNARFELRPLTRDQAPAWARLLGVIARADGDDEVFGEEDLLEDFDDPRFDFPLGSIAACDGEAMVGYSLLELRDLTTQTPRIRQEGGVHPDHRGRGLGAELLAWSERAARTLHERRSPGQPLVLSGQCLQDNSAAMKLYASKGFEAVRWFHTMERDLTDDRPAPPVPDGLTIVGFTAARSEDARLVRNEAFRDHWESTDVTTEQWDRFNGVRSFRPAYSFVCYAGGEAAGMIIGHEYEAYNETIGRRDLYIAMVGRGGRLGDAASERPCSPRPWRPPKPTGSGRPR
jgi:mycothiol synthase